jgi:hypothetical protein
VGEEQALLGRGITTVDVYIGNNVTDPTGDVDRDGNPLYDPGSSGLQGKTTWQVNINAA